MKTNDKKSIQKSIRWRFGRGERRFILITGDLVVTLIALFVALYFWAADDWLQFSLEFLSERPPFWYYMLPLIWLLLLIELYDIRRASRINETINAVGIAASVGLGFYLLVYFSSEPNSLPRFGVAAFILISSILTITWRYLYIKIFTAPLFMHRVLIIGAGRAGSALVEVVNKIWPSPFCIVGLIDDDPKKINTQIEGFPVLGSSSQLLEIAEQQNISDLIFTISGELNPGMFQKLILAEERGIEVTTMPVVYEELLGRVPILLLQSDWLVRSFVDQAHTSGLYQIAKRLMDIIGGLVGSVILIVLFPIISLAILLDSGSPVLYRQERLGRNGREHKIKKFRTMCKDAEKDGKAQVTTQNDQRVTRVGRLLRRSHLDELPQFISILRGDMSLVGPRSERREIINKLQAKVPFYRARLLVKPGLTGWAQVNFGYASTVEDTAVKLAYDLYYIKHRNIMLDFSILIRTIGTVLGFRGR